jgi:hypothetical protein
VAYSGTYNQTKVNVDELISYAYRDAGRTAEEITPEYIRAGKQALFYILQNSVNRGINIWLQEVVVLGAQTNQQVLSMPDNCVDVLEANWIYITNPSYSGTLPASNPNVSLLFDQNANADLNEHVDSTLLDNYFGASYSQPTRLFYVGFNAFVGPGTIDYTAVSRAILQGANGNNPGKLLFVDTKVGGRSLGDLSNTMTVTDIDATRYLTWSQGGSVPSYVSDWIENTLNPYILAHPKQYADYILGGESATYNLDLEVSNDNITWTTWESFPEVTLADREWQYFSVNLTQPFLYYRLANRDLTQVFSLRSIQFAQSQQVIPMARLNRTDYFSLPNKQFPSERSLQYWFNRQIDPEMYLWPVPNNNFQAFSMILECQPQDIGSLTNELYMPDRALNYFQAALSHRLAMQFPDADITRIGYLEKLSIEARTQFEEEDRDKSPIYFQPNISYYTR